MVIRLTPPTDMSEWRINPTESAFLQNRFKYPFFNASALTPELMDMLTKKAKRSLFARMITQPLLNRVAPVKTWSPTLQNDELWPSFTNRTFLERQL